jgi:predicted site-specific integrase-resolvase
MTVQRPADLVPMSRARATLGVSSRTLRRYTASGKLPDLRSPGGHRVLRIADLHALHAEHEDRRTGVLIYARVSCAGQKDDLVRQIEDLERAAEGRVVLATFSDVASGLSDKRRGLKKLLRRAEDGDVSAVLVTHPDRLARFGLGVIEHHLACFGCVIEVTGSDEHMTDGDSNAELVRDLLSVVTSFSGKLYGARANARRKALRAAVEKELVA